jgi:hypothetical protein
MATASFAAKISTIGEGEVPPVTLGKKTTPLKVVLGIP